MSASTTTSTILDDRFIFNINQANYYFQAALVNLDGAAQYIKPTAIKSFVIEDNFKDTFHKGYIIIDNMIDFIERSSPPSLANDPKSPNYYNPAAPTQSTTDVSFLLKGESRDILHIDIMPLLNPTNQQDLGTVPMQNAFRLVFDFAIYNSEEIPGDKPSHKSKKFYFHDLYYQLLTEKNIPFSTSDYLNDQNIINLDNTERTIPTGLAIQALLNEAFPRGSQYPLDIYYDNGAANTSATTTAPITPATIKSFDSTNTAWDVGGGKIFFSAPSKYKAIDSLNYLLARHVSNSDSNYDQCFLRLERQPRAMSLKSLKQYFDDALTDGTKTGASYLETIRIGNYDNNDALDFLKPSPFTPVDGVYFSNIGTIKSYTFDNMAGMYSQNELVSNFVHSYTYNDKQFNIDIERNSVVQSMTTYVKNYVQNMLPGGDWNRPFSNFAPGTIRSSNVNINNNFSVENDDANKRLAAGRNKFLYASTLTNNIISFRLKGSTHRQAGRFIGIDRDGAMSESQFDDKILGVYFILEVRHVFDGGQYYNDLHCIKTYNTLPIPNTDSTYTISKTI